jgi:general L-amino acid transport system substrate-binding protein
MKKSVFLGTLAASALVAGFASAATLDDVKARGELICGSNTGLTGFGAPDANNNWTGFDVDLCRAVAAAVLGDGTKVKFSPLTSETRFTALASGEVDLLVRNSTWTFSRDNDLKLNSAGVNYYDGQGFMVKKDLGVTSAKELDGATICIQTGTTTELNLADFFKANNMTYTPVTVADDAEAQKQFMAGACDAFTTDHSGLASTRASLPDPESYVLLPEIISKEPLGPMVRHGDECLGPREDRSTRADSLCPGERLEQRRLINRLGLGVVPGEVGERVGGEAVAGGAVTPRSDQVIRGRVVLGRARSQHDVLDLARMRASTDLFFELP